jgi:hypothetical protein
MSDLAIHGVFSKESAAMTRKIDCWTLPPPPVDMELMATSPAYATIMGPIFQRWMERIETGEVRAERTQIEIDDNVLSLMELIRRGREPR